MSLSQSIIFQHGDAPDWVAPRHRLFGGFTLLLRFKVSELGCGLGVRFLPGRSSFMGWYVLKVLCLTEVPVRSSASGGCA